MNASGARTTKMVLSEQMLVTWPILLVIGGATWWLRGTLLEISFQLRRLGEVVAAHDARLERLEAPTYRVRGGDEK